jgi:hypothetical protein
LVDQLIPLATVMSPLPPVPDALVSWVTLLLPFSAVAMVAASV